MENRPVEFVSWVNERQEQFGLSAKAALDLARMLDSKFLDLSGMDVGQSEQIATVRQLVLDDLGALCLRSHLPVPQPELRMLQARLSRKPDDATCKKAAATSELIRERLKSKADGRDGLEGLFSLAVVLDLLPGLMSRWEGPNRGQLEALINLLLMKNGLEPITFGASEDVPAAASFQPKPPRLISALIVDDSAAEIIKTFRSLVGWPDVSIQAFQCFGDKAGPRQGVLAETVERITAIRPDIVFMDQGMPEFLGSELIMEIGRLVPGHGIVFVGNTGGSPYELERVGAIGNCDKGRNMKPFIRAFNFIREI